MWFQIVLILALLALAVYLVRSTPGPRHLAIRRVVMLVGLITGVIVIIWPGLLTGVARAVGVGRGADLLFYLAIVAGLLYVVNEYKRSIMLTRANTQLARELVLTEARLTDRITELERRLDGDNQSAHVAALSEESRAAAPESAPRGPDRPA